MNLIYKKANINDIDNLVDLKIKQREGLKYSSSYCFVEIHNIAQNQSFV